MRQDAGFNPSRPGQTVSRRSDERQVEETLPTNSWESGKDNRLLEAAHCIACLHCAMSFALFTYYHGYYTPQRMRQ